MISVRKILFRTLVVVVSSSLGVLLSIYVNQNSDSLEDITATVLPEAKFLPNFILEDHHGNQFTNENIKDQWSFIFFGFTRCPDICPTTLVLLNQVNEILTKEKNVVLPKTIFVSIDPERDSKVQLAEYVPYFNKEFIGVTGSLEQLQVLTKSLGVTFGKEGETRSNGEDYEVFHSARIMLIDPKARLKAILSPPYDANIITNDYMKIIGS